jgi:glycosyltransferase involved in cell wall biosynthesis
VVTQIGNALQMHHHVENFFGSTGEFFGPGLGRRLTAPFRAFHDPEVAGCLRRLQAKGKFDLWQVHNIFPGLSPSVYQTAFSLSVPIIHFLHNYRFGCVNGLFLNHGQPCQRCIGGNFWPAFQTACWHDSRLISGWQALILLELRRRNLFKKIRRWVALSESQKALHLKMGFPEDLLSVVPHFYETKDSAPPPPAAGSVLFLSRLSPEKGGYELLKAWRLLLPADRELHIGGTGPEESRLRQEASSLSGIKFLGFLDAAKQKDAWAQSAFAVIPSIVPETFGMIVLEAWARQRPVIAHRIGALAETVDDGINGLLVDPGDSQGLAKAIQRLLAEPEKVRQMGRAGYEKLKTVYGLELWRKKMNAVYQETQSGP